MVKATSTNAIIFDFMVYCFIGGFNFKNPYQRYTKILCAHNKILKNLAVFLRKYYSIYFRVYNK